MRLHAAVREVLTEWLERLRSEAKGLRGVGFGAALHGSGCARYRPQGGAMRRGAQRRAQTRAVQTLRARVHAGAAGRSTDGFVRGIMRCILQLRTSQTCDNRKRSYELSG